MNAIYLYDNKITIIFNSGNKPVTVDDELLSFIEESNGEIEGSLLDAYAPPKESQTNTRRGHLYDRRCVRAGAFRKKGIKNEAIARCKRIEAIASFFNEICYFLPLSCIALQYRIESIAKEHGYD